MAVRARASTAEDLWNLPADGLRHDLVEGELRVMAPPGAEHGRVAATLGWLLFSHVREHGVGVTFAAETGFLLARDPDTVRAPDAAFVASRGADIVGRTEKYWPGAPDFAAEVISPGDTFAEVEAKALDWLEAGTALVLVLDPARRSATAYRQPGDVQVHSGDAMLDLGDAVPGWRVGLADFFR
jgi:Uma2 family endonuclease